MTPLMINLHLDGWLDDDQILFGSQDSRWTGIGGCACFISWAPIAGQPRRTIICRRLLFSRPS